VIKAIVLGGLVAGLLDILYAFTIYGPLFPIVAHGASPLSPVEVLQSVARGWVGHDAAAAGGLSTATLGAVTHFGIALVMAAVFVFAARVLPMLTRSAILWGLVYGLVLFFVMNYVVLPISAADQSQHFAAGPGEAIARISDAIAGFKIRSPLLFAGTIFTHTVVVGLPIALFAKRAQED